MKAKETDLPGLGKAVSNGATRTEKGGINPHSYRIYKFGRDLAGKWLVGHVLSNVSH